MDNDTKEIKNLDELNDDKSVTELLKEDLNIEDDSNDNKSKESKKSNRLKIIIIILSILIVLVLIISIILIYKSHNKKRVVKHSEYYNTIEKYLDSDKLSNMIEKDSKRLGIDIDSADVLSMDIDGDLVRDLVVYIEDKNKKYLLNYSVDSEISLSDSYEVSGTDGLGVVYSLSDRGLYFYTKASSYTIIGSSKKIMNKDEFSNNYYVVSNKYNNKNIIDNGFSYDLDKDLDVGLLEKNNITINKILKSNNLDRNTIINDASKYFAQIEVKEVESPNTSNEVVVPSDSFKMGEYILKYGKYVSGDEAYTINSDNTAIYSTSSTREECNWSINVDGSITINCISSSNTYFPITDGFSDYTNTFTYTN